MPDYKRVFKKSTYNNIRDIRSGQGEYTKKLAAGDTSPVTKRRAAQEADAAAGGRLPDYMWKRAKKGQTSRKG